MWGAGESSSAAHRNAAPSLRPMVFSGMPSDAPGAPSASHPSHPFRALGANDTQRPQDVEMARATTSGRRGTPVTEAAAGTHNARNGGGTAPAAPAREERQALVPSATSTTMGEATVRAKGSQIASYLASTIPSPCGRVWAAETSSRTHAWHLPLHMRMSQVHACAMLEEKPWQGPDSGHRVATCVYEHMGA